jgi:hypothetical protein
MTTRTNVENGGAHAWQFPLPVRTSRFVPLSPEWKAWNIETDAAAIRPFEFTKRTTRDLLWFDYHTALDGNYRGRLGSGRGGSYRGYYVKGLGRTPAAANWNDVVDRYHSTGHMAAGQVLREYLISRALEQRGLGHLIVPCETFLMQPLSGERRRQIARLRTRSNQGYRAPADRDWMALSLKPANFGRHANFVWALHHLSSNARDLGALFLDFQKLLAPPTDRREPNGEPGAIAVAMEAAIDTGFDNFLQFTNIGLFWIYMQNNVSLDGRFIDLETPLYLGRPFIGKLILHAPDGPIEQLLGFECFHWIRLWRCFVQWLGNQLELFLQPGHFDHPGGAAFLKDLRRALRRRFHARSFVFDDEAIRARAVAALTPQFGAKRELQQIARLASDQYWKGSPASLPAWEFMPREWAAPTPTPIELQCPAFAAGPSGPDAQVFAALLERAGKARDPRAVKEALGPM